MIGLVGLEKGDDGADGAGGDEEGSRETLPRGRVGVEGAAVVDLRRERVGVGDSCVGENAFYGAVSCEQE